MEVNDELNRAEMQMLEIFERKVLRRIYGGKKGRSPVNEKNEQLIESVL